jgi:hypothetical protein
MNESRIILEQAQTNIALVTAQSAHASRRMVMVNHKRTNFGNQAFANRTSTVLSGQHEFVLFVCHAIFLLKSAISLARFAFWSCAKSLGDKLGANSATGACGSTSARTHEQIKLLDGKNDFTAATSLFGNGWFRWMAQEPCRCLTNLAARMTFATVVPAFAVVVSRELFERFNFAAFAALLRRIALHLTSSQVGATGPALTSAVPLS